MASQTMLSIVSLSYSHVLSERLSLLVQAKTVDILSSGTCSLRIFRLTICTASQAITSIFTIIKFIIVSL